MLNIFLGHFWEGGGVGEDSLAPFLWRQPSSSQLRPSTPHFHIQALLATFYLLVSKPDLLCQPFSLPVQLQADDKFEKYSGQSDLNLNVGLK